MQLTAIAIDDEPKALEVVEMHASKVPFLLLKATFTDAFEALKYLKENKVDLLFLDISMPDISGIEFLGILQNKPMVIFTTAYSEYAVTGFELDAIDYLMKPFSLARFTKACQKTLELKQVTVKDKMDFLFLKTGYEEEKVFFDEILYIKAEGNYLEYVAPNRKLLSRQTITEAMENLSSEEFIRIHRSYIVPIKKIQKISRHSVWVSGIEIPIGVSFESNLSKIKSQLLS
ncbi:response regulator [Emticicia sp. CRIBPO]|uniref:LytR/AlgR family response regulator transcription factor n=1 Tax=Emticicia sp. CRIBPO TaxID=2683258 RepID=UPI0014130F7A|nr:LytTR family DNA-binding domain-containing protein [Emticicia sp. CRIBPO]NBA86691.1 response regulator [Emticicia sp. CRIBPO]